MNGAVLWVLIVFAQPPAGTTVSGVFATKQACEAAGFQWQPLRAECQPAVFLQK
jgi:hypothetical protein